MPNLPYSSTGSLPFGGKTVTINAVAYIARNWKPEKKTRKIRRDDVNGDQDAFMLRVEPTSQSGLTLQLASGSTAVPTMGLEFTVDTLVYVVTEVGKAEPQGEFHVVDISYESKVLPTD
jgi:hypothetical protein